MFRIGMRKRKLFSACATFVSVVLVLVYLIVYDINNPVVPTWIKTDADYIPLFRDVYTQDGWPEVENNSSLPGEGPSVVHYVWCGRKVYKFQHQLSLLSAVRILRPLKIYFYYHHLPEVDDFWYHTWFQELTQSVPNLVLRHVNFELRCGSRDVLELAVNRLAKHGGLYIGENTLLTRYPEETKSQSFFSAFYSNTSINDVTQGFIFSARVFPKNTIDEKVRSFFRSNIRCCSMKDYDSQNSKPCPCLGIKESLNPKDIWDGSTRFSELTRWIYYGKRGVQTVKQTDRPQDYIPLIAHLVWIQTKNILDPREFRFLHYLSVISALHVAGFQRVFVHGDEIPQGEWWDKLGGENVTFVKIEQPETVFQQGVIGRAHQSDVLRLSILLKHGGVYQDRDVIWVSKVPDDLRRYPAVACPDWPANGAWPEVFNMGVVMAKPGAEFLKHFLRTFSYYRDDKWAFNAVFMPYKTYEQHPDTLYVDRHLQVICFEGVCHPTWHPNYIRGIYDQRPVEPFDWRDARAFHFTVPKPPESLSSPEKIKNGKDVFAEMGLMILEKGGRLDLLS
ncbi:uncharacterized protein LOC131936687 [Physella acuta]|uniref:uncharacterized protein LOC131936687 n=1 Tax=Physella acuta TaxID=109671 RepID=UPI0027DDDB1B|nr:uncharacterized protein LOC131936687 [Physella acuta]